MNLVLNIGMMNLLNQKKATKGKQEEMEKMLESFKEMEEDIN